MTKQQATLDSRQIPQAGAGLQTRNAGHIHNVASLSGAKLHCRQPVRRQQARDLGNDSAIGREAVRAAVESAAGLESGDLRCQIVDFARSDVGRIAEDHVPEPGHGSAPVARQEGGPICQAKTTGIARGSGKRVGVPVEPKPPSAGQGRQDRQQEVRAPSAEIEHPARPFRIGDPLENGLYKGLAVGARIQRGLCDLQIEAPKLAPAEDTGDRLPAAAARDQRFECLKLGRCEAALAGGQQGPRTQVQDLRKKQPGVAARRFDAGLAEAGLSSPKNILQHAFAGACP